MEALRSWEGWKSASLLISCGGTESEVVWVPANIVLKLILLSGTPRAEVAPVSPTEASGCVDIFAVSWCFTLSKVLPKLFELPSKADSLLRS